MHITTRDDRSVQRALRRLHLSPVAHLSALFEQPSVVLVQAAAAAAVVARRNRRAALCIIAAPLLALAAANAVKHATTRPRPISHLFRRKGCESFPSSHTAGKGALVWMLAFAFPGSRRARFTAAAIASLDVLTIAALRVADGAHWPTDTLGGAAIGLVAAELVARVGGCRHSTNKSQRSSQS